MFHLFDADNYDKSATTKQITIWKNIVAIFKAAFPDLKHVHLSNTDGHQFTKEIEGTASRLVGTIWISETVLMAQSI